MAAIWSWVSRDINVGGNDQGSVGWNAEIVSALPSGWNLQRVIFSACDQGVIASAVGDTDYYVTIGMLHISIGAQRGSSRETPAYVGSFPCVPYQVQASRIDKSLLWNAVMSTPEMHADFGLRRSAGVAGPDALALYADFRYSVTGPFTTTAREAEMQHSCLGTLRYLMSRPSLVGSYPHFGSRPTRSGVSCRTGIGTRRWTRPNVG